MVEVLVPHHFSDVESKDRLKYSLAFLVFRLAQMLAYVVLIQVFGFDYFSLYSCMLGTSFLAISVGLDWRCQRKGVPRGLALLGSPSLFMAVALVLDAGLTAMARPDVQNAVVEKVDNIDWAFGGIDGIHCIGSSFAVQLCQQQHHWRSFIITQVFQFVLIYFILTVLDVWQSIFVGGLCIFVYSTIVFSAASTFEGFSLTAHADLLFLLFAFAISLFLKYSMVSSKRSLLEVLNKQNEDVVHEKVLRCKAEFACERLVSNCSRGHSPGECSTGMKEVPVLANADEFSTTASEAIPSAYSAPAAFRRKQPESAPLCPKDGGDCLPSTAVAWVENCTVPRSLNTLEPGERILCYDNVGRGLTYATIKESCPAKNSETADWVMVTLKDGTQLHMTADHPVAVQPSPESQTGVHKNALEVHRQCVRAEQLDVERDCLMVLRTDATPVASVAKVAAESAVSADEFGEQGAKNQWITVTVEQPDRHELFVATRDRFGTPGQPIAVGSSDRLTARTPLQQLHVKNSFLHGFDEGVPAPKRASSAPPSLTNIHTRHCRRSCTVPAGMGVMSKCAPAECIPADTECVPIESLSECISTLSGTTISGTTESSGCKSAADVKIGCTSVDFAGVGESVRLTDLMRSKSAGVLSMGSVHSPWEECSPCSFHFTWLRNPGKKGPCKASYMCEYCHDTSHHDKWRSKFRKRRHAAQPCLPLAGGPSTMPPPTQLSLMHSFGWC